MQIEHSLLDEGSPPVGARFVRPELVCEVSFREWTLGGEIRHPSFQRLRTDMHPTEVVREGRRSSASLLRTRDGGSTGRARVHKVLVVPTTTPMVKGRPSTVIEACSVADNDRI
jgi:ATP dependent DNA ligase-like protein